MICKDCIHNEMCYGTHTDDSPTCCEFLDKSRYVDISEAVELLKRCADDMTGYGDDQYALGIRSAAELLEERYLR